MSVADMVREFLDKLKAAGVKPHEGGIEEAKAELAGASDSDGAGVAGSTTVPAAPPSVASDDGIDDMLTELYALADGISDEELAKKIKAIGAEIRASQASPAGDETVEVKKEEIKEEKPAMDAKSKFRALPAAQPVAMDAAAVARQVEARINAKITAARECRAILGDVDPMAFDSAAGIYTKALAVSGNETKISDPAALREMVRLAIAATPTDHVYPAVAAALANDSKGEADPHFKHLANIRRA